MQNESNSRYLIFPVWIIAILAVGSLMHSAAQIFVWIVSSFLLLALLDPWYLALRKRLVPRTIAALILVFTAVLACSGLLFLLFHFSSNAIAELEDSKRTLIQYYESLTSAMKSLIAGFSPPAVVPPNIVGNAIPQVEVVQSSPLGGDFGNKLIQGLGSAVTVLTYAFLVPILTFFLMAERQSLSRILPLAFKNKESCGPIWSRIVIATRAFFLGNLLLTLATYPLFVVLFLSFGVKAPFTMAALSSFFNLIPFLGAVLAGFLPALGLLSLGTGWGAALLLYIFCVFIHMIIANFAAPKMLGAKVDINATTSTIALLAWGELWGGVGLILAIPIMATIKILFEYSGHPWLHWMAALMSENVDQSLKRDCGYKVIEAEPDISVE